MKFIKVSLLFFLLLNVNGKAQIQRLFDLDFGRFSSLDSSGIFELYFSFNQSLFNQVKTDSGSYISGSLSVWLENIKTGGVVVNKEYQFYNRHDDSLKNDLTGMLFYNLAYGDYKATVTGKDRNDSKRVDSAKFAFTLSAKENDKFSISDIQLARNITKSENENSPFYKNTYEVVPNPNSAYGENYPVVYYYAELYNMNISNFPETLVLEKILLNGKNEQLLNKKKLVTRKNKSIVEAGTITVNKYPTGIYTLVLNLTDTVNAVSVSRFKTLYIVNKNIIDSSVQTFSDAEFITSEFVAMGEEELDQAFQIAKYIASSAEVSQFESLKDADAKRNFLFNFWRNRDLEPETKDNEFKREYYKRVDYANQVFGSFNRKGSLTDRGRVYIVYGAPSEINRFPSEVDTKPYEQWTYEEIEGGVIFIFADLNGFGDYKLLHSTKRGELRDENWRRRIETL